MLRRLVLALLLALARAGLAEAAGSASATLDVDLTDAPRGLFHAVETLPAAAGPLTLVLPRWIPGEHGPTGPIGDLAGLSFTARTESGALRRNSASDRNKGRRIDLRRPFFSPALTLLKTATAAPAR